jgi:protein ImuB
MSEMGTPQRVMVVSCPELERPDGSSPDRDAARAFARLVAVVTEFCPLVESVRPGVCAFAARGPARYYGGETAVARKIVDAAAGEGFTCRAGVAEGLFAAMLAAGRGDGSDAFTVVPPGRTREFLGRQPVGVIDDPDLTSLLTRLGIRTLADLAALPAADVASRFGAAGEAAHRLARGTGARPLAVTRPTADLSVAVEFDPPETVAEPVVFAAKTLAERFHTRLAAHGVTCVRMGVQARWADGRETSGLWRHDGLLTAVQVADRVRWQLDGAGSPASRAARRRASGTTKRSAREGGKDTAGGIVLLRLVPDQVVRATGHQLALWGEALITDRVARAAMRVQAILGHEAVLRPVLVGGRDVRDRVMHVPFGEKKEPSRARDRPWPGRVPGPAPAVVYPEPRAARVTDSRGFPVTVTGRCAVSAPPARVALDGEAPRGVTGWAGPWPLTERWWDHAAASRRARFQLATDDGRAWLAAVRDGSWQIEAGYW